MFPLKIVTNLGFFMSFSMILAFAPTSLVNEQHLKIALGFLMSTIMMIVLEIFVDNEVIHESV